MKSKLHIANIDTVEKESVGNRLNFAAEVGSFSSLFKMRDLGCSLVELKPGKKAWPYHLHYGQEELFIVISGHGSIRYDDELYPIKAGDVIFTPPGDGTAHQIINTSDQELRYFALSSAADVEFCYYPDSKKYGAYSIADNDLQKLFIAHESDAADYFAGEDQ